MTTQPPPSRATTRQRTVLSRGDRAFRALTLAAGSLVLVVILAIAAFLLIKALPALRADKANFFSSSTWSPQAGDAHFGIAALAFGTLISSLIALVVGVPVAIAVALFITHYAPRRVASALGYLVDLLAAVPSIVFGLWGREYLNPKVADLSKFLHDHLGFVPIFRSDGTYGRSLFLAGLVLAIMILPIVTAISREVFRQTPRTNEEAALALGATRWEVIRTAVLPYGRPGVVAAVMLGLGRALGETMAVALVISPTYLVSARILQPGGNSVAANIANTFGEADSVGRGALIASGLVLFAITLVVNVIARAIIYRRREFAEMTA